MDLLSPEPLDALKIGRDLSSGLFAIGVTEFLTKIWPTEHDVRVVIVTVPVKRIIQTLKP